VLTETPLASACQVLRGRWQRHRAGVLHPEVVQVQTPGLDCQTFAGIGIQGGRLQPGRLDRTPDPIRFQIPNGGEGDMPAWTSYLLPRATFGRIMESFSRLTSA